MKKIAGALLLGFFTSFGAFEFDIGVSGGERGVDGFYFSIGEYYRVPQTEVVVVERSISRDDVNVAYFLARQARRDVKFITDLRIRGESWWDISLRLGLNPRTIYVVETYNDYGPPYGKAYGYSKKERNNRLADSQIVELVNVRFLSEYHGISPDEVIERRQKGSHYYYDRDERRERRHSVEKYDEQRNKKEMERNREDYKKREDRYKKDREREEYRDRRDKSEKNEKRGDGNNGRGRDW